MNFLAHTYLSFNRKELIIGNFIADHVKGNNLKKFRPGIIEGIHLHRKIDAYTDTHPVFLQSKSRISGKYRKYAGVIIDMFYDHFLSADWHIYSEESINIFTNRAYKELLRNYIILPAKTKRLLPYIIYYDWLASYANLRFLQRSLQGMSMRTAFNSGMEHAVDDLRENYDAFREEFHLFFPDIIRFVNKQG